MHFGGLFSDLSAFRGNMKATSAKGGDLRYMITPFILVYTSQGGEGR